MNNYYLGFIIEDGDYDQVIKELTLRLKDESNQYHYQPEGSIESKRILNASITPNACLKLLKEYQHAESDLKELTLKYVKDKLIAERAQYQKELNLSEQFKRGEIQCTIQA